MYTFGEDFDWLTRRSRLVFWGLLHAEKLIEVFVNQPQRPELSSKTWPKTNRARWWPINMINTPIKHNATLY